MKRFLSQQEFPMANVEKMLIFCFVRPVQDRIWGVQSVVMNCLLVCSIWGTYRVSHGCEVFLVCRKTLFLFATGPPGVGGGFHGNIL